MLLPCLVIRTPLELEVVTAARALAYGGAAAAFGWWRRRTDTHTNPATPGPSLWISARAWGMAQT